MRQIVKTGAFDAALFANRPRSRTKQMRRTLMLSSLYMLALTLLALPYGLTA